MPHIANVLQTAPQATPPIAPPNAAPKPPGVGDLLPSFAFRADHIDAQIPGAGAGENAKTQKVNLTGHVVFTMGDLRLTADNAVFDPAAFSLEATGNVVLTRGDEVLRGDRFFLDSDTSVFQADNGQVVTPPFFIAGQSITQKPGEIRAKNARLAPDPEGKGEIQFRASDVLIQGEGRTTLTNATVYILGLRLLTLKKITIEPTRGSSGSGGLLAGGSGGGPPALPLVVRASGISGTAVGVNIPFGLPLHISGRIGGERTTKQGTNTTLVLHRVLVPAQTDTSSRSLLPTPGGIDKSVAGLSPLRQLLKARPTPLGPDPVLDNESVLFTRDILANPTRRGVRNVALDFAYVSNREVGTRRQGPLLLSRTPELLFTVEVPLARPFERDADNAQQRDYLRRRLRFVASAEGGVGKYQEVRLPALLTPTRTTISRNRQYLLLGFGTLPYLVGSRVLVAAQTAQWISTYSGGGLYRYGENTLSGDLILGVRQVLGVSYIGRGVSGKSPFFFDQVDTQTEGQVRAQSPLPFAGGRYTLGLLGRYDLTQKRFFDTEIALAIKGRVVEPRISYKTLNSQIGLNIAIPGFSSPSYPARLRRAGP